MSIPAAVPDEEAKRLARLKALSVLDTAPEAVFDNLTAAAAAVCGTPMSFITMIDERRMWFKAKFGGSALNEGSREASFCAHTILEADVMVVRDLTRDARFLDHPMVRDLPKLRFYAGAQLRLSDGTVVGSLCVLDRKPKSLTPEQIAVLRHLAEVAVDALEFREKAVRALATANREEMLDEHLYAATPAMLYSVDPQGRILTVSDRYLRELGYERRDVLGRRSVDFLTEDSKKLARDVLYPQLYATGHLKDCEVQMRRGDGEIIDVLVSGVLERDAAGEPLRHIAVLQNVTGRKRTERELLSEKARMSRIIDGTNAGTWEWNIQTGETRINARWAEIIGFSLEELQPLTLESWSSRIHPDDVARFRRKVQGHFKGASNVYEINLRIRHKNGQWVWVHDRGRVSERTPEDRPLWMHGVRLDISVRKKTEIALRASQKFLERVGAVARIGAWEFDLATRQIAWSDETCRLHDVPPGYQPTLEGAVGFYTPSARPLIQAALEAAIAHSKPFDLVLEMVSAKQRAFWARSVGQVHVEYGKPVRLVGTFQDVTAQKETERREQESRDILKATLEAIGDGVIAVDGRRDVLWMSRAAERLTGWSTSEARGQSLAQVFAVAPQSEGSGPQPDMVALCLAGHDTPQGPAETILIARDGSEVGVERSVNPIRDPQGVITGVLIVFRETSLKTAVAGRLEHCTGCDGLTQ